eukprot:c18412_g1_i1 orf=626-1456(-)
MTEEEGSAAAVGAGDEEVKTLFISGLPNDIKEREIYNLFRTHPGYESCQLKYTGRGYQIVAFAVFTDQATALAAKAALNGHKIDPELGSTLHIELAKSNSRGKRPLSDERGTNTSEKKFRGSSGMAGVYSDPGMVHSVYNELHGYPPSQSALVGGYAMPDGLSGFMMGSGMPAPPARGSNAPCSTLFVANLGSTCTDLELTQAFSRFPGFRKVKMQSRGGLPVAFAEFQDTGCSTQALSQLQNVMLPSSVQGGIRLEYAKSRMGQPGRERLQQAYG